MIKVIGNCILFNFMKDKNFKIVFEKYVEYLNF